VNTKRKAQAQTVDVDLIFKVVKLGQLVRSHRAEGRLLSVPPPTIYGYQAFLRMAKALPHLAPDQIALVTVLGNASQEDRALVPGLLHQVFGLQQSEDEDDPTLAGQLL
jgi:hypothetical protein